MLDTIALILLALMIRYVYYRVVKHLRDPDQKQRCRCGHLIENQSVPRCPACGRLIGFNATDEELGLSEEELRRAQEAKAKREQKDSAA